MHAAQQQRTQQYVASGSAVRQGAWWVQEEVLGMEGGLAEAQAAFAMLDVQMSRESQTAAKIGDRLHVRHLLLWKLRSASSFCSACNMNSFHGLD